MSCHGRGIAIVGQDNLRRTVLQEHDVAHGANIGLIDTVARYALDHRFHVIIEGILATNHYGQMLTALLAEHRGRTCCFYLDVPFEETVRRHSMRPQASEFTAEDMASWYEEHDLLPGSVEQIITADTSLEEAVDLVVAAADLNCPEANPTERPRPGG
ncbi:P-loop NTPase family protein [Kitasatospora acidiphila]|uniref:kinase n=1 Tax=Kitasatospora acidiphila TaxID=2567942 RepID=UPI001C6788B3|nr:kinase [Kitasatospora acidiphila]